jgi:uncharacterized protein
MINPGEYNFLKAKRVVAFGVYLSDAEGNEVLLPKKQIPADLRVNDDIKVFVYNDSQDRLIATTRQPMITVGQFAMLKVKEISKFGAFLDWGLEKDLLVPFREQTDNMEKGKSYIFYLYLDTKSNRLVASAKLKRFLEKENIELEAGEKVDLLVTGESDLGLNVIINNKYFGLIFENDLFSSLSRGDKAWGYIKQIRPDNKIDVVLQKPGYSGITPGVQKIIDVLKAHKGFLNVSDNSSPQHIAALLEMSKKTFKKAIGHLYKEKIIAIKDDGIYLLKKD